MEGINTPNFENVNNICYGHPNDDKLFETLKDFSISLDNLENDLTYAVKAHNSPKLTIEEQIKLDTFLTYLNSTLFWMYLKLQGSDINKHYILHDLSRAKELLAREMQITCSLSAHRLDITATKRFIAAGIHTRFVDMDGVMVTEAHYKSSVGDAGIKKQRNNESTQ
ncbi:nuclear nucleic acid-binding protein C1D [Drosophila mojavensis]|uniref:Nuclear nucleic acid-binding protein C1D n=1 Tax=Drosophila mojavensis TaxID=7230 RepID=B4L9V1_DROMO|nr:nuclear nucleic acid-binding protein C1D [Drosophila mojavensis]EDW17036.2 uncharacterized protein Dmoj_GI14174 [Drosophila mojavensis]